METSLKTQNQKPVSGSVLFLALLRLALLLGPEALIVKTLGHNPIICILAGVVVLGLWLWVDVWPFRATSNKIPRSTAKEPTPGYIQNMGKAQWWSYFFCKAILVLVAFHSKLTI